MLRLVLFASVLAFGLAPSTAEAGRWHREGAFLYYCYDDGSRVWYDDGAYYCWRGGGWQWYAGARHARHAPYYAAGYSVAGYAANYYAPNYYGRGHYAAPWLGYGHLGRDYRHGHFGRDGHLGIRHLGHVGHRR